MHSAVAEFPFAYCCGFEYPDVVDADFEAGEELDVVPRDEAEVIDKGTPSEAVVADEKVVAPEVKEETGEDGGIEVEATAGLSAGGEAEVLEESEGPEAPDKSEEPAGTAGEAAAELTANGEAEGSEGT